MIIHYFLIWGPLKIPDFYFSIARPGNLPQIYLKHAPSLFSALTNCFMTPSLICNGGKTILDLSTSG